MGRRIPHRQLADQPREQRPHRGVVIDAVDRDLDRGVELLRVSARGAVDQLADQPDVVLDHAGQQVHGGDLPVGRQPQAAGWVEVDAARRLQPDSSVATARRDGARAERP